MATAVQFIPILNRRDAIGKLAINIHKLVKGRGIRSLLFTESQQSFLKLGSTRKGLLISQIPDWDFLGASAPDVLIYHHSIGTQVAEHFVSLPAKKKIVVYHGITPAELVGSQGKDYSLRGVRQLSRILSVVDHAIGFSDFTVSELNAAGHAPVIKLPYYLPEVLTKSSNRFPTVLVVGRVVRHKRVFECVHAFSEVLKIEPQARMLIVGSVKGDPKYVQEIRDFIGQHGLQDQVKLLGKIVEWRLQKLYRKSKVYLTLSAHEGFCVPVLEALRAGLQVISSRDAALSETVGEDGVFVNSSKPTAVAQAICEGLEKGPVNGKRLLRFSPRKFEEAFLSLI